MRDAIHIEFLRHRGNTVVLCLESGRNDAERINCRGMLYTPGPEGELVGYHGQGASRSCPDSLRSQWTVR